MMRWIIGASLRSRGLVAGLAVGVLALGVLRLNEMPQDVLPEFKPPTVEVQTEALGLSAEEVEQLVTVPLEQDLLNGVAFLDVIRSESLPGLSRIEMIFEAGTDVARARQVVNERLTQAHALPHVSTPPQMLQPLSSTSRVMMIGLSSKTTSLIDVSVLAKWTIRPALMGVPGVANVAVWGQREEQLQVQVDPARLQTNGVTLEQIIRTTGNALWVSPLTFLEASTPGTPGFFDTSTQRLGVQHIQPIKTPDDLAKVVLETDAGAPRSEGEPQKRLGDVATVVEDHQPLIGDAVLTDGPGLLLVIEKFPEANTLDVTRELDRVLKTLEPGLAGVDVDASVFRPAEYIENASDNLRTALLIGLALLVLALGALLFELRSTFISVVAVLLSLAAAIAVLSWRGETLNAMVLAGLVLATVVLIDDAVMSAHTLRRGIGPRPEGLDEPTVPRFVTAVLDTRVPLLYATAILLLALAPIFVLTGETGAFLPSLALSYGGAVVASMIVAVTAVPALSLLVARDASRRRRSPLVGWVQARYEWLLDRFVRTSRPGFFLVGALLMLGLAVVPFLDRGDSLVPAFRDRDLLVHFDGPPGTSLTEMRRITARASQELRTLPGVENVGGQVGRAVLGDQAVGVNASELWVSIASSADYEATVDSIQEVVHGYPGIDRAVLTYSREKLDQTLGTTDGVEGKDLTVRVFGQDLDTLQVTATRVRDAIAEVDGVDAPRIELPVQQPTIEVKVDLDRAQALGIKPGDVRRAAATVLSGIEVGSIFEEQKIFQVVVWGAPQTRNSLDDVRQLKIDRPDGAGQVRLDEVADARVTASPNVIRHEDVSRSIDIGVDVRGRDVDAVARDIKNRIRALDFALEYHAELLDNYQDKQAARLSFIGIAIAAAIGTLLLLQAAFGSWRMAGALFVALPGALAGGVLAARLDGELISIGSIVGFFAVFGLAARNSVLLVRRGHDLENREGEPFGAELVRRVAREHAVPTLTSAVATGMAFLPILFLGGVAGLEIVHPMAVVILGGLVTATALNLFAVPALYLRFGARRGDREESEWSWE